MIKPINFLVFILFAICASAQDHETSFGFNANYGGSITPSSSNLGGQHSQIGLTYTSKNFLGMDDNEVLGVKGAIDFDRYNYGEAVIQNSANYIRLSAEVVCNASNLITPSRFRWFYNFNVFTHAGVGLGVDRIIATNGTEDTSDDHTVNDRIGHVILGITPTYNITDEISINVDGSAFFNFKQQLNFDGQGRSTTMPNTLYTIGAGLVYKFNS